MTNRAANLKRRAFMLRFHAERRGADGKSVVAQRGGRARMGDDPAIARAIATEMALCRWYKTEPRRRTRLEDGTDDGGGGRIPWLT